MFDLRVRHSLLRLKSRISLTSTFPNWIVKLGDAGRSVAQGWIGELCSMALPFCGWRKALKCSWEDKNKDMGSVHKIWCRMWEDRARGG
jgi:hypothetical protein